MGSRQRIAPQQPSQNMAVTPAAQALAAVDGTAPLDPVAAPASGYDALAETRKRIAAAAGRRSLLAAAAPAPLSTTLGAG